ncbi:dTDP-4-dehydrorhamnose reductase [Rarobacter faecitabidus]|uniref:dTDP-4-dehydrorhamnose reductase n=1 Tax=Rarobacter faecitabidus TaxID=13243 RepID=A0A542ZU62_RARFA|nr:dTDP-4-dehydrorhamnose reductase [Rarobacter faecitabidus]TQL63898.1 dTDP-4-dehydrorhamnose reductase [Rarobacter faecitabidus]
MSQWYVVGADGMLARDLMQVLADNGLSARGLRRSDADITSYPRVAEALTGADVVVNCAAFTAVDAAEEDEAAAFDVNAVGAANLARAARANGARLVHISTDYVFAGDATQPYGEDAAVAPRSAYGRTKAAGEWAVMAADPRNVVLRTAWLYGEHGNCFPKTIARILKERGEISVVNDQVGQPTWTLDLARLIVDVIREEAPGGIYHGTASGHGSWFDFARAIASAAGIDPGAVRPTDSASFVRPAPRPAYSVLGHHRLTAAGVEPIGDWRERWQTAAPAVLDALAG